MNFIKRKMQILGKNQSGIARSSLIVVLIGSLFVGALGYAYTRLSGATSVPTYINVGTYNLRSQRWDGQNSTYANWSTRKARVKTMISNTKPGIIGMQEVIKRNPDTGQYVSQRNDVIDFMTPMNYGYVVGSVDNSSPIFWNKGNFSKLISGEYLIFDSSTSTRSDPPASRYLTYARLQQIHHRKNVIVMNYHFNQFEQEGQQLTKLANVVAALRSKYPNDDIFFTGDFNGRHSKVMTTIKNNKGISLRTATSRTEPATTQDPGVDHVLISGAVATRGWTPHGLGSPPASDHPLVIARLTI